MIQGESGLLNIYPPTARPNYQPSLRRITWANGAQATIYSAHKSADKSGLRGPQHEKAWGDEPAKWQYPENLDQLMFGLRLGTNPQAILTGTPRSIPMIRNLVKESKQPNSDVILTIGSTFENRANLAASWFDRILNKYKGTRLGQQELEAKLLEDIEGALWTYAMIQACYDERHSFDDDGKINQELRDSMERVVVAVDPSVNDGKAVDITSEQMAETGIVVCGRRQNTGHLLEDASLYGHPSVWAEKAIDAYRRWNADYIVAEKNNGGELVRLTLQSVPGARHIPVKLVSASRGKYTRAEPVALLHERGGIKHHCVCAELEDQLTQWIPGMKSPDRLDAYVWCFSELLVDIMTFGISMAGEDEAEQARQIDTVTNEEGTPQVVDRAILQQLKGGRLYFPG
jgi:phage terminase large subunit-like protein